MSTPNNGENGRSPPSSNGHDSNPLGPFDPALVSRLANELYRLIPDAAQASNGDSDGAAGRVTESAEAIPPAPPRATPRQQALIRASAGSGSVSGLALEALRNCQIPEDLFVAIPRLFDEPAGGFTRAAPDPAPGVGRLDLAGPDLPQGAGALAQRAADQGYYFLPAAAVPAAPLGPPPGLDVEAVRREFPALHQSVHGQPLVWLDNAATTHKPHSVIDALARYYQRDNSNVHRGAHTLAGRSTDAYEAAREKARRFLGASSPQEIVFVRGATEAINLVAQSYGRHHLMPGDEVLVTLMEHHSNIVPWQMVCREKGARLRPVPISDRGEVLLEEYERLLGPRTRIVAFTHVSNALGTVNPAQAMTEMAHRHGARVLIDGAQAVQHLRVDVQALDCDWYALSGHKLFGPNGIGVLYGKKELLQAMPPWQGGGSMIADVTFDRVVYNDVPAKFEAGTGSIGPAVGLGAAIDFLDRVGLENIARHEQPLLAYGIEGLQSIPGVRLIGTSPEKVSVLSFVLNGVRTEDLGRYLDQQGIAVRAGHHCAQPALRRYGVESTVRPSLALYNTREDIDRLLDAVRRASRTIV